MNKLFNMPAMAIALLAATTTPVYANEDNASQTRDQVREQQRVKLVITPNDSGQARNMEEYAWRNRQGSASMNQYRVMEHTRQGNGAGRSGSSGVSMARGNR